MQKKKNKQKKPTWLDWSIHAEGFWEIGLKGKGRAVLIVKQKSLIFTPEEIHAILENTQTRKSQK